MSKYILDGKTPIKCNDILEWARWFEQKEVRIVKKEYIGQVLVSTVFLGIDHAFGGVEPILFETMIFGGLHDEYCARYSTWDEAERGHDRAAKLVNGGTRENHN